MEIVAKESLGFIDNVRIMTLDERLTKLKQLGTLLSETLKRGEEKVALAKSTYDTVCICCLSKHLGLEIQKGREKAAFSIKPLSEQANDSHYSSSVTCPTPQPSHIQFFLFFNSFNCRFQVDRHCTRLDTDLQKFEDEQMIGPGRISVQLSGGLLSRKEDGVGANGEKKSKAGLDKKDKEARGEKRAANGAYIFWLCFMCDCDLIGIE